MNLGPLNDRCRIEYKVVTPDPTYGTDVITWTPLRNRDGSTQQHCDLQDVLPSRSERVADNLEVSQNPTRWRTRYRTDVDSSMRIVVNRPAPTIYQIISGPAILGDKDGIECMLEKVSTSG